MRQHYYEVVSHQNKYTNTNVFFVCFYLFIYLFIFGEGDPVT